MSKFLNKTVKKWTLTSVIMGIVLAAAIVVCALFGFNKYATLKDGKTLTVSMNQYVYLTKLDDVKVDCEAAFGEANPEFVLEGKMSGDESEIVYVFDADADVAGIKAVLEQVFATKTAEGGVWEGSFINVSASVETANTVLAKHYALRTAIAGVVFTVLAFAYVAIRYGLNKGIVTAVCTILGMLMTASVIVLTRVSVTASVAYVISLAGILTAVMTLLTMNKLRSAEKNGENDVVSCIAVKEVLALAIALGVAVILVGVFGKTAGLWFAVSALIGVAVSTAIAILYAPAVYAPLKEACANKPKSEYVGAKKTSTKAKKVKATETAPVEETKEVAPVEETKEVAPVEETKEEAPVEETKEEAVEETEETVEEAEVEEPVEETVEAEETADQE